MTETEKDEKFMNGVEPWIDTHFEISAYLAASVDKAGTIANDRAKATGRNGLYMLAIELTNKFEKENANRHYSSVGEFCTRIVWFLAQCEIGQC